MFDFLKRKEESRVDYTHVALNIEDVERWCEDNKVNLEDGYLKCLARIKEIVEVQVEQKIPVLSFLILPLDKEKTAELLKCLKELLEGDFKTYLKESGIRATLLGKWYDLPPEALESLKRIVEETKDNTSLFLNLCLNYDGQEELVDAFKIMARQLIAGKLSADNISQETIKENIYSSYFPPPDLMIKNGSNIAGSFFLWDSVNAKIVFTEKDFPDFDKADFEKVLK